MAEAAVIIGASKGLGKAMAYQLAAAGVNCILSARNESELNKVVSDIAAKNLASAIAYPVDLEMLDAEKTRQFVEACFTKLNNINRVYITAAVAADDDQGTNSINVLQQINDINYQGAALLATAFSEKLQNKSAVVAVISSVAAIRPRGRNISYSASKIALEYHIKGLRHFFVNKPLRLQIYRVGYMDTDMAAEIRPPVFKKKDPAAVAKYIISKVNAQAGLYYYPGFWSLVAITVKMIPWFIYKKLKF